MNLLSCTTHVLKVIHTYTLVAVVQGTNLLSLSNTKEKHVLLFQC